MKLLGYTITPNYPKLPFDVISVNCTINPNSYCGAKRDTAFATKPQESDV